MNCKIEIKINKKPAFEGDVLNLSEESIEIINLVNNEISRLKNQIRSAFFQKKSKKETRKDRKSIKKNSSQFAEHYYLTFFYDRKNNTLILYNVKQLSEQKTKFKTIYFILWGLLCLQAVASFYYFLYFCFEKNWGFSKVVNKRAIFIWVLFSISLILTILIIRTAWHELKRKRWCIHSKTMFGKLRVMNLENSINGMSTKTLSLVSFFLFSQLFLTTLYSAFSNNLEVWRDIVYIVFMLFLICYCMCIRQVHPFIVFIGGVCVFLVGLLDVSYWEAITPILSVLIFLFSDEIWKLSSLNKDPLDEVKSPQIKTYLDKKMFRWKVFLSILPSLFYLYLKLTENSKLFSKFLYLIEKIDNCILKLVDFLVHTTSQKINISVPSLPIGVERGIDRLIMVPLIVVICISIIKAFDKNNKSLNPIVWLRTKIVEIVEGEILGVIDRMYSVNGFMFYEGKLKKSAPKFPTRRRKF